jgi:uncharacterized lipoprotein YmbA
MNARLARIFPAAAHTATKGTAKAVKPRITRMARIVGDSSAFIRAISAIRGQKFCGLKFVANRQIALRFCFSPHDLQTAGPTPPECSRTPTNHRGEGEKCGLARISCLLFSVSCLLITGGCSLWPEAKSDPTRFYVLSTSAAGATPRAGAPTVQLRPIELASYLATRPMIIRRGHNEIEFREFARWGEPLESGIGRVLREELVARGAASAVLTSGARREHPNYDYTLSVRVLSCEGSANGAVVFRAIWELSTTAAKATVVAGGDFRPGELRWDGKSEASLAAELSQAVAALAGEIAGALAKK